MDTTEVKLEAELETPKTTLKCPKCNNYLYFSKQLQLLKCFNCDVTYTNLREFEK